MSRNVVGTNPQSSGWWGSKSRSAGGAILLNSLATPAPLASCRARIVASRCSAVTAGVVFTAPVLQLIAFNLGTAAPAVNVGLLTLGSVSGALLGFGFAGLLYLPWLPTLLHQVRYTGAPWLNPPNLGAPVQICE